MNQKSVATLFNDNDTTSPLFKPTRRITTKATNAMLIAGDRYKDLPQGKSGLDEEHDYRVANQNSYDYK